MQNFNCHKGKEAVPTLHISLNMSLTFCFEWCNLYFIFVTQTFLLLMALYFNRILYEKFIKVLHGVLLNYQ